MTLSNRSQIKDGFHVYSGEVNFWDTAHGKLLQRLPVESLLTSIALSRDGKTLAVGTGGNQKVKTRTDPTDTAPPETVGDKKGTVRIWQLED